jgi:Tol biopolymer transport system component
MRADGTEITRITRSRSELQGDGGASWSPDGHQIVFSGHHGRFKGTGVYVVNRDGSGLRRLSNFPR